MGRKDTRSTSAAARRRGRANRASRGARAAAAAESAAQAPPAPPSRWGQLGMGLLLGLAWGAVMCAIFYLTGQFYGWWPAVSILVTTALIGSTAAAVFGSFGARRRGERVGPRLGRRR